MRLVVEAEFCSYHRQIDHCGFYTLVHFIEVFIFVLFFGRTPVETFSSPRRLDLIMKSLHNSPKPLFPVETQTPPESQGFSTSSEETDVRKGSPIERPASKAGDFSLLEFEDVLGAKDSNSTPDKSEDKLANRLLSENIEASRDVKSQNMYNTLKFGYQQRMNFNMDQGSGMFQQKPRGNKKKRKKWNQSQGLFQQQERNNQSSGDYNYGNYNANSQMNCGPQQGMAQWGVPCQGNMSAPQNYQGNQFFIGGPTGLDQGPRPQNVGPGNFVGNFSQQGPPVPNFSVPPPNIPPMDFFRKFPPPNFPQQGQPSMMQNVPQNPLMPQQAVPPPSLQPNQPPFFSPNPQSPYSRLPPPPPFQANLPTPPSQFLQSNIMQQQQQPQNVQSTFQFPSFNSPAAPPLNMPPVQQTSPPGTFPVTAQVQGRSYEPSQSAEAESFSLQAVAVSTSSIDAYNTREISEPWTPSPVKNKPIHLPPNWKSATDPQGKVYYYHTQTR